MCVGAVEQRNKAGERRHARQDGLALLVSLQAPLPLVDEGAAPNPPTPTLFPVIRILRGLTSCWRTGHKTLQGGCHWELITVGPRDASSRRACPRAPLAVLLQVLEDLRVLLRGQQAGQARPPPKLEQPVLGLLVQELALQGGRGGGERGESEGELEARKGCCRTGTAGP